LKGHTAWKMENEFKEAAEVSEKLLFVPYLMVSSWQKKKKSYDAG